MLVIIAAAIIAAIIARDASIMRCVGPSTATATTWRRFGKVITTIPVCLIKSVWKLRMFMSVRFMRKRMLLGSASSRAKASIDLGRRSAAGPGPSAVLRAVTLMRTMPLTSVCRAKRHLRAACPARAMWPPTIRGIIIIAFIITTVAATGIGIK